MSTDPVFVVADRYEALHSLGMGGMGSVFLARDRKFGVDVALKVAAASGLAYQEFKARFIREARIGYVLGKAECIVRALDWGELEPGVTLYLVLDLVPDARPLDLRAGPLPQRLKALRRCAQLVASIHERGVVHRDIKPANFLMDIRGKIYLSDFGVAKVIEGGEDIPDPPSQATQTGSSLGTPLYMAPEQFKSSKDADKRTDVYSLGVMLYNALTGEHPFPGETPMEVMSAQLDLRYEGRPTPRPSDRATVDPGLDRLCADAIALDPARRPADAAAFVRRLTPERASRRLTRKALTPRIRLRLDEDGFVDPSSLQGMQTTELQEVLGEALTLRVQYERPLKGKAAYQGRLTFLLPRQADARVVTLGRTPDNDIVLPLPTISKVQLVFEREDHRWLVSEQGSRNGTLLNEEPLERGRKVVLVNGDVLYLSKHFTVEVLPVEAALAT